MKRMLVLLACVLLVLPLGGCAEESAPNGEALLAYRAVLQSEAPFYAAEQQADVLLSSLVEPYLAQSFALVDLDGDGVPEAVLALGTEADPYFGREVLHYADGQVTGYFFDYRAMSDIRADGTFLASSGAADTACLRLAFTEDGIEETALFRSESTADGGVAYWVGEASATEAELNEAFDAFLAQAEPLWYDLIPEGLAEAFPTER